VVVGGAVVTSSWFVFWVLFLFGFAGWVAFGGDVAAGGSLVCMAACCGSVVLVVSECCFTSLFTSWLLVRVWRICFAHGL